MLIIGISPCLISWGPVKNLWNAVASTSKDESKVGVDEQDQEVRTKARECGRSEAKVDSTRTNRIPISLSPFPTLTMKHKTVTVYCRTGLCFSQDSE